MEDLWGRINHLVPEPQCATADGAITSWTDVRAQPSEDALLAVPIECLSCCTDYCKKVNELKDTKFKANAFEWPAASGHLWQTTEDKQQIVASRALKAISVIAGITGAAWEGEDLTYRTLANFDYSFPTAQSFIDFTLAYDVYRKSIAAVCITHKDALMAINKGAGTDAEKIAAMEAYDYNTGWPV